VTARWVVDEVRPHRDICVEWQPISLFLKNQPDPESDGYARSSFTHGLLRVLEAVREKQGLDALERLYWEYGRRIHHDRDLPFEVADALGAVGLDADLAGAFDDGDRWDDEIRSRMKVGIDLAGDEVGTPIIAMDDCDGELQGYFGPVITRVPPTEQSLKMWDALQSMMDVAGFWELKRTRTERPSFGDRP
jgi:hypothetical protein